MDRNEILQILEDDYGTSNPLEIPEIERWRLYDKLKFSISMSQATADEYTRQIILISDTLEL